MHVVVTGAGSFIGGHATAALSRAGLRVTASFRTESAAIGRLKSALPDVDFVRIDLACADHFQALPKLSLIHI